MTKITFTIMGYHCQLSFNSQSKCKQLWIIRGNSFKEQLDLNPNAVFIHHTINVGTFIFRYDELYACLLLTLMTSSG